MEEEFKALGLDTFTERGAVTDEYIRLYIELWTKDDPVFNGKHYQLAEPMNLPPPLTKPHPPILVGGGGEKKTLRLVAQYADACNLPAFFGNDEIARKLKVLEGHCEDVGRPYDEIERTALGMINLGPDGMSVADVITTCRELADIGIQHFIFSMPNGHEITPIETIGREVIPAVAEF